MNEGLMYWLEHQRSNAGSAENAMRAHIRKMLATALDAVELDAKETAMSRIRDCIRQVDKQTREFEERIDKMRAEIAKGE